MVVGCGALGNEVLKNLVLMGARHIVAVDFDEVEPSNLTRSILFRTDDATMHRRKTEVVCHRLKEIRSDLDITTIYGDIAYDVGMGVIRRMNVVIGCVDSRWARYCINRWCMRANIPWVDGGISVWEGTARVFIPGVNCYACNLGTEGLRELKRRMPCSGTIREEEAAGHAPTTSLTASVIGAIQVQEALKLIHRDEMESGELKSLCGKMYYHDGQQLTTRIVDFKAYDDDCALHTAWSPIVETDVSAEDNVETALSKLSKQFGGEDVTIYLADDCFVDYVAERATDKTMEVMQPGRRVAIFIDSLPKSRKISHFEYYQHEYRSIDSRFPYKRLSLKQIGVPQWSVLPISVAEKEYYIEMTRP
jgi:adenylyltransferase/sulfurtransferase